LTFLNLAQQAGPGTNEQAGLGAIADLLVCMTDNDCLVEPLFDNFMSCCIVVFPPPFGASPVCKEEFNIVVETVDLVAIGTCFAPILPGADNLSDGLGSLARGVPEGLSEQEENVSGLSEIEKLEILFCLLKVLLPPEAVDTIVSILEKVFNIIVFVVDKLQDGISIPGELILFVFGWADFEDGSFNADNKWFYCMTSVAIFLAGIELFKLLAVRFIVWTKR